GQYERDDEKRLHTRPSRSGLVAIVSVARRYSGDANREARAGISDFGCHEPPAQAATGAARRALGLMRGGAAARHDTSGLRGVEGAYGDDLAAMLGLVLHQMVERPFR